MEAILKAFMVEPLFNACAAMLEHLHIQFNEVTRTPVSFEDLYQTPLTKALQEVMAKVEQTFFIGTVDEASLSGHAEGKDIDDVTSQAAESRYTGMMIFAVDVYSGESLTRTEMATLTRGFNRIAVAQPVILFIRQGKQLALATCERSDYTQQWRDGEKLGKVSILRGINCEHPHRGHIDILESIGDKPYPTFEELYKHWMQVFSSELLTKKFYSELSDWYAWAVQVARFPNNLKTNEDDDKFNHESCIRLITRLIFVWFLKEKHLIPEEFFDEQYIREHFIDEFNPHERKTLLYDAEQSKYYRLILQNLFFAMLNCPIVADGEDAPNNRRFLDCKHYGFYNPENDINNLMRYKDDFKEGGADEFVALANNSVPFLNGGLFDCLDDKPNKMYYDGFSEYKRSLEQLYLPDWLFFGDEVGRSVDLSQWYGDAKKKKVSARGIIDILKRYNFTIEENTPLDQEVSLDPELLGKAFENLLASYNPETKTSARKQTGSFYTPREIVQYMVNESLVAHLKRTCGEELEQEYRRLLSYATDDTTLNKEQCKAVMQALYNCRVLDPACGSGAFPMGVLQQMVHVLRQLDPTNEMWKDFMIDLAIEQSRVAFSADAEEERKARLADIEEAFNKNINDPDYARKLYLIEHCIYGVDIQTIAVQISKLRFFISLVVDQKPTTDAAHNFGIRPLPNLESKFVAANTLIPVEYDGTLVESAPEVHKNKERLKELNHKIFLAKRNVDKQRLKAEIKETRKALAQAIEDTGFVGHSEAELLAGWDMFNQNASSFYFDSEWMFGVKGGFDVIIGNPPYLRIQGIREANSQFADYLSQNYKSATGSFDLYVTFVERGLSLINKNGIVNFIMPTKWTNSAFGKGLRKIVSETKAVSKIINFGAYQVFNASTYTGLQWFMPDSKYLKYYELDRDLSTNKELKQYLDSLNNEFATIIGSEKLHENQWILTNHTINDILDRLNQQPRRIKDVFENIFQGLATSKDDVYFIYDCSTDDDFVIGESKQLGHKVQIEKGLVKPLLKGEDVHRYDTIQTDRYVIFPYKIEDGKALLYSESELAKLYPMGYEYLKECEEILREREHGRLKNDDYWYRYIYPKNLTLFDNEKLVAPEISLGGNFAYDKNGDFYSTTKIYGYIKNENIKATYKSLMAILNSKVLWFYMSNTGYVLRGGYFTFKTNYVNPFPLPDDEAIVAAQPIIEPLVDCLTYLYNSDSTDIYSHTSNKSLQIHFNDILDMVVYELYFADHMKEQNIDVIDRLRHSPLVDSTIKDDRERVEKTYNWFQKSENLVRQSLMLLDTRSRDLLYFIHLNATIQ